MSPTPSSRLAPPRLVLFDIDGTLVDSLRVIVEAMAQACAAHGLPTPPEDRVRRGVGLSLDQAIAWNLPALDARMVARVADAYREAYFALRSQPDHQEPLFPGALEAIAALESAGYLLGLATGKSRRGVRAFLDRHALHHAFVTVHTADDGPGKPHPAMILEALNNTGAEPALTVMLGDTTFDMDMARAARVGAIGVAWGNHPAEELMAAGAAEVIDTFGGLMAAVRRLTGA